MEMFNLGQGFLRLLLTETEAQSVLKRSKELQRCLAPLEVGYLLKREIKRTVTPAEKEAMQRCWIDFCKHFNYIQDSVLGELGDMTSLENWFKWIPAEYREPLPEASPWGNAA